jgi:hypothetical protein
MLRIVEAKKSHLNELVRIGKENWPKERWVERSFFESRLRSNGIHLTAFLGSRIAGSIKRADSRAWGPLKTGSMEIKMGLSSRRKYRHGCSEVTISD